MTEAILTICAAVYAIGMLSFFVLIGPEDMAEIDADLRWKDRLEQSLTGRKQPELPRWASRQLVSIIALVIAAIFWPLMFIAAIFEKPPRDP